MKETVKETVKERVSRQRQSLRITQADYNNRVEAREEAYDYVLRLLNEAESEETLRSNSRKQEAISAIRDMIEFDHQNAIEKKAAFVEGSPMINYWEGQREALASLLRRIGLPRHMIAEARQREGIA